MTHNEKRTHWVKEGAIGLGTGILFGLTNVCVGHVSVVKLESNFLPCLTESN
jgi:hypothetical protein